MALEKTGGEIFAETFRLGFHDVAPSEWQSFNPFSKVLGFRVLG